MNYIDYWITKYNVSFVESGYTIYIILKKHESLSHVFHNTAYRKMISKVSAQCSHAILYLWGAFGDDDDLPTQYRRSFEN